MPPQTAFCNSRSFQRWRMSLQLAPFRPTSMKKRFAAFPRQLILLCVLKVSIAHLPSIGCNRRRLSAQASCLPHTRRFAHFHPPASGAARQRRSKLTRKPRLGCAAALRKPRRTPGCVAAGVHPMTPCRSPRAGTDLPINDSYRVMPSIAGVRGAGARDQQVCRDTSAERANWLLELKFALGSYAGRHC